MARRAARGVAQRRHRRGLAGCRRSRSRRTGQHRAAARLWARLKVRCHTGTAGRPRGSTGTPRAIARCAMRGARSRRGSPLWTPWTTRSARAAWTVHNAARGVNSSCRQGVNSECRLTAGTKNPAGRIGGEFLDPGFAVQTARLALSLFASDHGNLALLGDRNSLVERLDAGLAGPLGSSLGCSLASTQSRNVSGL